MSFSTILHDPTWPKVYLGIATASVGILAAVTSRILVVRSKKRDIYKPSVLLAETYGVNDERQIVSDTSARPLPAPKLSRRRKIVYGSLAVTFSALIVCGFLFSLRNYIILTNWDEGNSRLYIKDYVGAYVAYGKAMRVDQSIKKSHLLMGIALMESGKVKLAIPELELASKDVSDDTVAITSLGDAYMILRKYPQAEAEYLRAIKISPNTADFYIAYAGALENQKKFDESYKAYESALKADPRKVKAHIKLGDLLAVNGHMDEALAHCRRAVLIEPNNTMAHDTLATEYARYGMFDEAIEEYKKSIDLDPRGVLAFYNLGETYVRKSDFPRALEAFKASVKFNPKNKAEIEAIRNARDEIYKLRQ